jgi:hypothetical protein
VTVTALIRLGPVFNSNTYEWCARRQQDAYDQGAFKPLLPHMQIPVLIDHQKEGPQVGTVGEFSYFDDIVGGVVGPWAFAHCTIEQPPAWLRDGPRGTRVSFSYKIPRALDQGGWNRIYTMAVTEVSLLSPGVEPVEPLARVVLLEQRKDSPAVATSDVAGEIIYGKPGELIRRPGIGQMLGVR